MLKNASSTGISIGAPLQLRGTWHLEGGSYTGGFEGCKDRSSNGASLPEGLHQGDLKGGSFTRDPAFGENGEALFT